MVKLKTPELTYAKRALLKFLEMHDLNPAKDYSNHPIYGKEYKELLLNLNLQRDKVLKKYPLTDLRNLKKLSKMKKVKKEKKEKKLVDKAVESTEKKKAKKTSKESVAKEEKKPSRTSAKYDYPLVDGREMTADEKKKYRQEQRKLANGGKPKEKKTEKKAEKKEKVEKEKKSKKDDKKEKKGLKVSKKGKKSKKDED